jgi:hypothetical protein
MSDQDQEQLITQSPESPKRKLGDRMKDKTKEVLTGAKDKLSVSSSFARMLTGGPDMYGSDGAKLLNRATLDNLEMNDPIPDVNQCQILVTCAVATTIRNTLRGLIQTANEKYTSAVNCSGLVTSSKTKEIITNVESVKKYTETVKNAQSVYTKDLEKTIPFTPPLECVVLVKNGVTFQNVIEGGDRAVGKITALKPKDRKLIVSFVTYKAVKGATDKPITVPINNKSVDFSRMCIGSENDPNAITQCTLPAMPESQTGGNGSTTGDNDEFSAIDSGTSDIGICE